MLNSEPKKYTYDAQAGSRLSPWTARRELLALLLLLAIAILATAHQDSHGKDTLAYILLDLFIRWLAIDHMLCEHWLCLILWNFTSQPQEHNIYQSIFHTQFVLLKPNECLTVDKFIVVSIA
jgi:hypothetical protein